MRGTVTVTSAGSSMTFQGIDLSPPIPALRSLELSRVTGHSSCGCPPRLNVCSSCCGVRRRFYRGFIVEKRRANMYKILFDVRHAALPRARIAGRARSQLATALKRSLHGHAKFRTGKTTFSSSAKSTNRGGCAAMNNDKRSSQAMRLARSSGSLGVSVAGQCTTRRAR